MKDICLMLLQDPVDYYCGNLKNVYCRIDIDMYKIMYFILYAQALLDLRCDEDALCRIIRALDKKDARRLLGKYKAKYNDDLLVKLKEVTGGIFL